MPPPRSSFLSGSVACGDAPARAGLSPQPPRAGDEAEQQDAPSSIRNQVVLWTWSRPSRTMMLATKRP